MNKNKNTNTNENENENANKRIKRDFQHSVLETHDVLCVIFEYFDIMFLFSTVRMVCKQWKKVLATSPVFKKEWIKSFPSMNQPSFFKNDSWMRWLFLKARNQKMFSTKEITLELLKCIDTDGEKEKSQILFSRGLYSTRWIFENTRKNWTIKQLKNRLFSNIQFDGLSQEEKEKKESILEFISTTSNDRFIFNNFRDQIFRHENPELWSFFYYSTSGIISKIRVHEAIKGNKMSHFMAFPLQFTSIENIPWINPIRSRNELKVLCSLFEMPQLDSLGFLTMIKILWYFIGLYDATRYRLNEFRTHFFPHKDRYDYDDQDIKYNKNHVSESENDDSQSEYESDNGSDD